MLRDEKVDFILDASRHPQPLSLLRIALPDNLLLNLKLHATQAIQLAGKNLSDNMEIKKGMITDNPKVYYISLWSTLYKHLDLELIPGIVSKQQLN